MSAVSSTVSTYIKSVTNPEDMVRIPGSSWVVVSGYVGPSHPRGQLYLVNADDHAVIELFPDHIAFDPDPLFADLTPPGQGEFAAHGVSLRVAEQGPHTLYLVHHGSRESVEIFTVDAAPDVPVLTWVGAVELDEEALLNDVAPHPDGGFVVSDTCTGGLVNAEGMLAGQPCGRVLRWTPGDKAMSEVPGSVMSSPNGVEVSSDGSWCYVASWVAKELVKLSLSDPDEPPLRVSLPVMPDNFTWSSDGRLLITGQISEPGPLFADFVANDISPLGFSVIAADPHTLELDERIRFDAGQGFGMASCALEVGDSVWVGSPRADRIAVFAKP